MTRCRRYECVGYSDRDNVNNDNDDDNSNKYSHLLGKISFVMSLQKVLTFLDPLVPLSEQGTLSSSGE